MDAYFVGMPDDLLTSDPSPRPNGIVSATDGGVDEETSDANANSLPTFSSASSSSTCHKTLTDSCLESDQDIGDDDDEKGEEDNEDEVECNMDDNVLYINLRKDGISDRLPSQICFYFSFVID